MRSSPTSALSPLDGRYAPTTLPLRKYLNEAGLITYRIQVELVYLQFLSQFKVIRAFTKLEKNTLKKIAQPTIGTILRVKNIEEKTHHDVKAVEYYLREQLEKTSLKDITSFIHFAITSEDINNLAYRLQVKNSLNKVLLPELYKTLLNLRNFAEEYKDLPMLARTHGQAAIPTTLGKEYAVFALRLLKLTKKLSQIKLKGKFNGAVGGYQAMILAHPKISWLSLSRQLVESFGFEFKELTTQILAPDDLVELFSILHQLNSILLDLNQDTWRYISDDWLIQKGKEKYVGSSTMPQKINPIEFENSEGNLVIANSLLEGMIRKLPISRLQRDLSESTVLRNIGSIFGYCLLGYTSLSKGLTKLDANKPVISQALHSNYNILTEAWQTMARKAGDKQAYEKIAQMAKKKIISAEDWRKLTRSTNLKLAKLTPDNYLGLSVKLTKKAIRQIDLFLKSASFA